MNQKKDLSVIILNYKNPILTLKCVETLIQSSNKVSLDLEVIVVDNSASETALTLKELIPPEVKLIENLENLGFSKANNQGIVKSKGKYILLLNNDAFVNPETLQKGIEYLENNKETGIWASKLIGEDGMFQVSCAKLPSLTGLVGEYVLHKNYDWYPDLIYWNKPHHVGNVIGAFMLIPSKVIEKVGLLDEDYFFTVEDVDYCKKVQKAGFSVVYDPRCDIVHISGASQENEWVNDPYMHKNRVLYFRKNHGILVGFLAYLIIGLGIKLMKFR